MEETNTLILELRYLFVQELFIMGLKRTATVKNYEFFLLDWKSNFKAPCNIFLLPCYSVCEAARVKIDCNSGSNKIPFRFDFV